MEEAARYVFDRRPLAVILAEKLLRPAAITLVFAVFFYLIFMPRPQGLSLQGQRAVAVFVLSLALWLFQLLPLMITSLFALILIPLLGVMSAREAYSLFGNEAVFFILGAFILASAMMSTGLSSRISLLILRRFGRTPRGLMAGVFFSCALFSFVISEHAVAAMMFPIVLEVTRALNLHPKRSPYGKAMFLSLSWGCVIGGVATFLGGARVPLAMGILKETAGVDIGFGEYTVSVLPTVVILLIIGYGILMRFSSSEVPDIRGAGEVLSRRIKEKGLATIKEKTVAMVMIATICAWMGLGRKFGLANISLGAVVLIFLLRIISWKDVEEDVNWGIILMYGGAICLGSALEKSGAALWLTGEVLKYLPSGPFFIIGVLSLLTIVLTEAMSNSAVIAILMPVGVVFARSYGLSPKVVALAIAMPAGLAYALPTGTPACAIAYSSGYMRFRDMAVPGAFLALISWAVFLLMAWFYWPLVGLKI